MSAPSVTAAVAHCLQLELDRLGDDGPRAAQLLRVGRGLLCRAAHDDGLRERRAAGGDALAVELPEVGAELDGAPAPVEYSTTEPLTIDPVKLLEVVRRHLPQREAEAVRELSRLSGGFSKEMALAKVEWGDGQIESMVVRKVAAGRSAAGLHPEFELLAVLSRCGIAVPEPWWFDADAFDGPAMATAAVAGGTRGDVGGWRARPSGAETRGLARSLAAVHRVELGQVGRTPLPPLVTRADLAGALDERRRVLDALGGGDDEDERPWGPLFEPVVNWLVHNLPDDEPEPVLVHGDYGPHNLMMEGDEVIAVLDWERAHVGRAAEDLAYARPTFEDSDWQRFLEEYIAAGGAPVADSTLRWFGVWQDLWRAVSAYRMRGMFLASPTDVTYGVSGLLLAPRFLASAFRQVTA